MLCRNARNKLQSRVPGEHRARLPAADGGHGAWPSAFHQLAETPAPGGPGDCTNPRTPPAHVEEEVRPKAAQVAYTSRTFGQGTGWGIGELNVVSQQRCRTAMASARFASQD